MELERGQEGATAVHMDGKSADASSRGLDLAARMKELPQYLRPPEHVGPRLVVELLQDSNVRFLASTI